MHSLIKRLYSAARNIANGLGHSSKQLANWAAVLAFSCACVPALAVGPAEKPDLKFGFIKPTDMAPLAIALEKGYFEEEGLFVETAKTITSCFY